MSIWIKSHYHHFYPGPECWKWRSKTFLKTSHCGFYQQWAIKGVDLHANDHESIASPRMMKDNIGAVCSCQKSFKFLEVWLRTLMWLKWPTRTSNCCHRAPIVKRPLSITGLQAIWSLTANVHRNDAVLALIIFPYPYLCMGSGVLCLLSMFFHSKSIEDKAFFNRHPSLDGQEIHILCSFTQKSGDFFK